jgi:asparagine synthase (glutamine-hydrolysing)
VRSEILSSLFERCASDPINEVLFMYQFGWLPEDPVARADRMSLAHGVEVRFPLLDRRLMAFVNRQPGAWKVGSRLGRPRTKLPLRRLLEDVLPPRIVDRPKVSFPSPLSQWLRGPGAPFLATRVERLLANRWGLWRPDAVRQLVRAHEVETKDQGKRLWVLVLLDAWLEHIQGG